MACSSVRAAVLVKPKTLEAREFARPATGPDDALLRIEACGICGSDYEQYEGAQPAAVAESSSRIRERRTSAWRPRRSL
jgi:threonine dehydrogenase-like Zn-dependent dehydrogenase